MEKFMQLAGDGSSPVDSDDFGRESVDTQTAVNLTSGSSHNVSNSEDTASARFTEEDLRRAREQEKSKLYNRIDRMSEELTILKNEREEAIRKQKEKEAEEQEALRKQMEQEMDVRQLLEKKEQEFNEQLDLLRREQERDRILLEREREYSQLVSYRVERLEEERESILPELIDMVSGNSIEEIEDSIAEFKERSKRIVESAQQAVVQQAPQVSSRGNAGARVTMPSAGPLDGTSDQRILTPEDLRNMSMTDYAKNRNRILGDDHGRGRGMFG